MPATPAVALIQVKEPVKRKRILKNCMLKLYDLCYDINNFENIRAT